MEESALADLSPVWLGRTGYPLGGGGGRRSGWGGGGVGGEIRATGGETEEERLEGGLAPLKELSEILELSLEKEPFKLAATK